MQVTDSLSFLLHDMNAKNLNLHIEIGKLGECSLSDKFTIFSNVLLILLFIPVLNSIIYPFLREYVPNMLKRIGLGSVMALLSLVSALLISAVGSRRHLVHDEQCMFAANFSYVAVQKSYDYSPVSEYYVLIPQGLITLAEIFINITCKQGRARIVEETWVVTEEL